MCCILPYNGLVLAQISSFSSSRIIETYYAAAHFSRTHSIRVFIFIFIVKAPSEVPCHWCILRTHAWCDQLRSILSLSTVQLKYKALCTVQLKYKALCTVQLKYKALCKVQLKYKVLCTVQSSNKSRRVYIKHSHFFSTYCSCKDKFLAITSSGFLLEKTNMITYVRTSRLLRKAFQTNLRLNVFYSNPTNATP
jgi:hypothetical protein